MVVRWHWRCSLRAGKCDDRGMGYQATILGLRGLSRHCSPLSRPHWHDTSDHQHVSRIECYHRIDRWLCPPRQACCDDDIQNIWLYHYVPGIIFCQ